jgi:predicted nucleic acid-binding Zn ribbon protein
VSDDTGRDPAAAALEGADESADRRTPARRLLDRARKGGPAPARRARRRALPAEEQPWSGAAADGRDPARLGASLDDLVRERHWEATVRSAGLSSRWDQIVGAEIAAHCRPERLTDGELTCVAESTAWATQIRLLNRQIRERIAAGVGPGVVRSLRVHGPTAPDWRHGPLRVRGRGPRDTYG